MDSNVYNFDNLSPTMKKNLLDYIAAHYSKTKSINVSRTAYGLKQQFTARFGTAEEHVTSQCFKEAMEVSGFRSKALPQSQPNWSFNVYVLKNPRPKPID